MPVQHDASVEVSSAPLPTPNTPAASIFISGLRICGCSNASFGYSTFHHTFDSPPAASISLQPNLLVRLLPHLFLAVNLTPATTTAPFDTGLQNWLQSRRKPLSCIQLRRGSRHPLCGRFHAHDCGSVHVRTFSSASTPITVDSSVPEEIPAIHTTINAHRFELVSPLADVSSRISDLDHPTTEITRRLQDFTAYSALWMCERDARCHSHTTFTTEHALFIASTA